MTTAYPLGCVLMELSAQLEKMGLMLCLVWKPREENTHADDLSNGRFGAFREENRVKVDLRVVTGPRRQWDRFSRVRRVA